MQTLPPILKGKKASETFMDYVEPYLKYITSDGSVCTFYRIEVALRLPWCIWNAIECDQQSGGKNNYMKNLMKDLPPFAKEWAMELKKRKEELFSQYNYIFGEYSLFENEKKEVRIRVEAKTLP